MNDKPAPPPAAGRQQLSGHLRPEMAQAPLLGELDDSTRLHLAIALPVRNSAQLDVLIEDVSNPRNPRYRQYLTPDQVTEQFGPAEQDYQALIEFFEQSDGLAVSNTYANRIVVDVTGNARSIQSVFHVNMQRRRRPDGSEFYAPDREPSLDLDVPVMHITGLDNYILPKAHAGSAPGGSYGGSDFRNAYAPGVTLTGTGQTVALVEFDGFYTADIEKYKSIFGLSVPVQVVTLNGYSQTPGQSGPQGTPSVDQVEVSLDIEMAMAMAPGLDSVVVVEGGNGDSILAAIASPGPGIPLSRQVSASYTWAVSSTTQALVNTMAVQGQTFFVAAGDGRSFCPNEWNGSSRSLSNLTVVGGTNLTMSGDGQAWQSESAAANGGGVEINVPIPAYQVGLANTANGGSGDWRNVPDVSLVSSGVFICASNGAEEYVGGTSVATPLWAAFVALVNQRAALDDRGPVGFINPAIYMIGASPTLYARDFHDIQSGTSKFAAPPCTGYIGYDAVPGYDLVSGWGTPQAALVNDLAAPPDLQIRPSLAAVTAWRASRLDIFAPGTSGTMKHKAWTGTAWDPSGSAWEDLGGEAMGLPGVASWAAGRLDIVAPLTTEGTLVHKAWGGTAWTPAGSAWEILGTDLMSSAAIAAWAANRLDIFAVRTGQTMEHKAWTGSGWSPGGQDWEDLGGYLGQPAVASWAPDRLDVFAVDGTNVMRHKAWTGTAWDPAGSEWEDLGGKFASPPAVASWAPDRLDICAIDLYGDLLHKSWTGAGWNPAPESWEDLGGPFASAPAVASWGPDRLDIVVVGSDGSVKHKAWTGSGWNPGGQGWEDLGGECASAPVVASWGPDRLDVFVIFTDGSMRHKYLTPAGWGPAGTAWEDLGGEFS